MDFLPIWIISIVDVCWTQFQVLCLWIWVPDLLSTTTLPWKLVAVSEDASTSSSMEAILYYDQIIQTEFLHDVITFGTESRLFRKWRFLHVFVSSKSGTCLSDLRLLVESALIMQDAAQSSDVWGWWNVGLRVSNSNAVETEPALFSLRAFRWLEFLFPFILNCKHWKTGEETCLALNSHRFQISKLRSPPRFVEVCQQQNRERERER